MTKNEKTKIEFDYNGKHYKLEYTASSLKKLEKQGVSFAKLDDMIFSAPEVLFRGAFFANHPTEDRATINKLYKILRRSADDEEVEYDDDGREVDKLTQTLADMIAEAVDEITGRGEQGNLNWKVTR